MYDTLGWRVGKTGHTYQKTWVVNCLQTQTFKSCGRYENHKMGKVYENWPK